MLLAVTLVAGPVLSVCANAQTFFYTEVAKDGRLYVFAVASRHDAFVKSGGVDTGPVITRPGYGTNGETVVFDSADAVNLYNFKHGLPSESFPVPAESPRSGFPAGKISGLMFGDYYWYYRWHQDQTSSTNPTSVEGQHGLWFRRIYFTYDLAFNERLSTRFRLEMNSNGDFEDSDLVPYVKDASLQWTYVRDHHVTLGIQPSLTFDWLDEFWGLRHIEKTPADLYRLDSSRDFGVAAGGPVAAGVTYAVQLGNESGTGSEAQDGKILRLEGRFERPRRRARGLLQLRRRGPMVKIVTPHRRSRACAARPGARAANICGRRAVRVGTMHPIRRSASGPVSPCGMCCRRRPICFFASTAFGAIAAVSRQDCQAPTRSTTCS